MNKIKRFTDKDWKELASLLSDEKSEKTDLLKHFIAEDNYSTGKQWKELRNMSGEKEINIDNAWNNVYSRLNENDRKNHQGPARFSFMRSSFMRVAAVALIILSFGTTVVYLNNTGAFNKKINLVTGNDQKNLLVALPDGSRIFLNRNTKLSYRSNFGKHRREVRLT